MIHDPTITQLSLLYIEIRLVNTKFGGLLGGRFSGLFLCADHENQSHFALSRQYFFKNLI